MPPIRRRNILVGARMVHYRRAGSGKPVVLLHESPMNSSAFVDLIERLRRSFTVFAFDTPGFGDSDPIPRSELRAHHFADALAETFRALKMPRCPVYGLDTGAAIALSFGRRHPQLTSGLVLQGLPIFDAADRREFLENYTPPFANRWDGSHLTGLWTRIRDHRTFFPWYSRNAAGRGVRPIPPAEELHERLMGFLRAGNHYRHGYDAAFGQDAERLLRKVRVPLTLLGQRGGLLAPPLEDLRLSDNQRVVWISPGGESPVRALRAAFRDYSGRRPRAPGPRFLQSARAHRRRFCRPVVWPVAGSSLSRPRRSPAPHPSRLSGFLCLARADCVPVRAGPTDLRHRSSRSWRFRSPASSAARCHSVCGSARRHAECSWDSRHRSCGNRIICSDRHRDVASAFDARSASCYRKRLAILGGGKERIARQLLSVDHATLGRQPSLPHVAHVAGSGAVLALVSTNCRRRDHSVRNPGSVGQDAARQDRRGAQEPENISPCGGRSVSVSHEGSASSGKCPDATSL